MKDNDTTSNVCFHQHCWTERSIQQWTWQGKEEHALVLTDQRDKDLYVLNVVNKHLPSEQEEKRDGPQYGLIHLELVRLSSRSASLVDPSVVRTDQEHKPEKKTGTKPSDMSKVINSRKRTECQIHRHNQHKSYNRHNLKTHKTFSNRQNIKVTIFSLYKRYWLVPC